jgi:hypothetical protein
MFSELYSNDDATITDIISITNTFHKEVKTLAESRLIIIILMIIINNIDAIIISR